MIELIELVKNTPKTSESLTILGKQIAFKLQTQTDENKQMMYELIGEELGDNVDSFIAGASAVLMDKKEVKIMIDAITQITLYSECLDNQLTSFRNLANKTPDVENMLQTLEELNNELKKRVAKKSIS